MYWTYTSSHFSSIRVIFLGKLQTDTVCTLTSSTDVSLEPTCIIPAVLSLIRHDKGVINYLDLFRSFPFYFLFLADGFMSEELGKWWGCCVCSLNVLNVNSKCGTNNRTNEDECGVSLKCHSKTWILHRWGERETDRVRGDHWWEMSYIYPEECICKNEVREQIISLDREKQESNKTHLFPLFLHQATTLPCKKTVIYTEQKQRKRWLLASVQATTSSNSN